MKEFDLIIIGGGRASNLAVTAGKAGKKSCPNRKI